MRKKLITAVVGLLVLFMMGTTAYAGIEDNRLQFDSGRVEEDGKAGRSSSSTRSSGLFSASDRDSLEQAENSKEEEYLDTKAQLFTEQNLKENRNMQATDLFVETGATDQYQTRISSEEDNMAAGSFFILYGVMIAGIMLLSGYASYKEGSK